MTAFTVLLPHKRNPGNDRSLSVCLDCLFANTVNDFRLNIDAAYDQPLYPRINAMVEAATTEVCVYWSSDIFAAPGWDDAMLQAWSPNTIVTGVLVEPGMIGVHHETLTEFLEELGYVTCLHGEDLMTDSLCAVYGEAS